MCVSLSLSFSLTYRNERIRQIQFHEYEDLRIGHLKSRMTRKRRTKWVHCGVTKVEKLTFASTFKEFINIHSIILSFDYLLFVCLCLSISNFMHFLEYWLASLSHQRHMSNLKRFCEMSFNADNRFPSSMSFMSGNKGFLKNVNSFGFASAFCRLLGEKIKSRKKM